LLTALSRKDVAVSPGKQAFIAVVFFDSTDSTASGASGVAVANIRRHMHNAMARVMLWMHNARKFPGMVCAAMHNAY
jgi:hypothetical protein